MADPAWQAMAKYDVVPGVASLPEAFWEGGRHAKARYVEITVDGRPSCLRVVKRSAAGGHQIWVAPGSFDLGAEESAPVERIRTVSARVFRQWNLLRSANGRLAVAGLCIALVGMAIELSFKVGDALPIVTLPPWQVATLLSVGGTLQVLGLFVVFWRGVWLGSE